MHRPMRGVALASTAVTALIFSLILAACGNSTTETAADSSDDHSGDGEHQHALYEVPDGVPEPTIEIEVEADPVSGVNVHVEVTDFEIAAEQASTGAVAGQGHFHAYVDGRKVARFYNESIHLPLAAGEHLVMVELSTNAHSTYAVDGVPISDQTEVAVPAPAGEHKHHEPVEAADPVPAIDLSVTPDPKSGWRVRAEVEHLTFAPRSAGLHHVDGEGHLHLYLDGEKVARLYGEWWHLDPLTAGEHDITVEATANDHRPYVVDGDPVTASVTIDVTADQAAAPPPTGNPDTVIEIDVVDGSVKRDDSRFVVEEGSVVELIVTTDAPDHVHIHGYEILTMVHPDDPVEILFTADSAGVFEVELEDSGLFLFDLQVS